MRNVLCAKVADYGSAQRMFISKKIIITFVTIARIKYLRRETISSLLGEERESGEKHIH